MSSLKQELEDYKCNREYIKKRKQRIEELMNDAEKITSTLSFTRVSNPVADRLAEKVADIVDMQSETLDMIANQEKRLNRIDTMINELRQPYKNILYDRYVEGKDLVVIAAEMRI